MVEKVSDESNYLFLKNSIKYEKTSPYSPHQNKTAEGF